MIYNEFVYTKILAALRKKIVLFIVKDRGLSQKKAAPLMKLTEGAISQYMNDKRATNTEISDFSIKKYEYMIDSIISKRHEIDFVIEYIINNEQETFNKIFKKFQK